MDRLTQLENSQREVETIIDSHTPIPANASYILLATILREQVQILKEQVNNLKRQIK